MFSVCIRFGVHEHIHIQIHLTFAQKVWTAFRRRNKKWIKMFVTLVATHVPAIESKIIQYNVFRTPRNSILYAYWCRHHMYAPTKWENSIHWELSKSLSCESIMKIDLRLLINSARNWKYRQLLFSVHVKWVFGGWLQNIYAKYMHANYVRSYWEWKRQRLLIVKRHIISPIKLSHWLCVCVFFTFCVCDMCR